MSNKKTYHVILTAFISNSWEVIRMYECKKVDSLLIVLGLYIAKHGNKRNI